jgi:hypothetical protein
MPSSYPAYDSVAASQAREIVSTSPALSRVLPADYAVVRQGPWTTEKTHELLGSVLELGWAAPVSVTATLPADYYDESETRTPPYQAFDRRIAADNVTGFVVFVDLRSSRIVSVTPTETARVTSEVLPSGLVREVPATKGD